MGDHSRTMIESVTDGTEPPRGDPPLDVSIKLRITPRGKGRPRTTFKGGVRTYTPKTTREYQAELWELIKPHLPDRIEGPIRIDAVFFLKRPKRLMAKKHADVLYCTSKPDLDNCCKALWDACKACFEDQQVVATSMLKVYATKQGSPQILIRVRRPKDDITSEINRLMWQDV